MAKIIKNESEIRILFNEKDDVNIIENLENLIIEINSSKKSEIFIED